MHSSIAEPFRCVEVALQPMRYPDDTAPCVAFIITASPPSKTLGQFPFSASPRVHIVLAEYPRPLPAALDLRRSTACPARGVDM